MHFIMAKVKPLPSINPFELSAEAKLTRLTEHCGHWSSLYQMHC